MDKSLFFETMSLTCNRAVDYSVEGNRLAVSVANPNASAQVCWGSLRSPATYALLWKLKI